MRATRQQRYARSKKVWSALKDTQHFRVCLGLLFLIVLGACVMSSCGGSGQTTYPGGWTDAQQNTFAFNLAQDIVTYRHQIHDPRAVNYGFAYMEITTPDGTVGSTRPEIPYVGMNSQKGPLNDTHSENKLKGWARLKLRKLGRQPQGTVINLLIFTQVQVCDACSDAVGTWARELQQDAGGPGITVNLYIWEQKQFLPAQPDRYSVQSQSDVVFGVSASTSALIP